jgi:NADH-quinone oxidoreductase subunit N
MARRRRLLSQEAALKYFLLGGYASAFFLFGSALIYGYSGSLDFGAIAEATSASTQSDALLIGGIALISVGLLFKIGAAPFHQWTPDVYQGAPTVVTGFMAACTKVAAFGALLRIMYVAFGGVRFDWRPMMAIIAVITMFVGVLFALTQTDMKRMLAYSSIAQAGFILTGVIALSEAGISSVLFYLLAYGFATIGTFAVVTLVRDGTGEATHLSSWRGLGKRSPVVASLFAIRSGGERHRSVLLRPRHRADVLQRTGRGWPHGGRPVAGHDRGAVCLRRRDRGARSAASGGLGSGRPCRDLRPLSPWRSSPLVRRRWGSGRMSP